MNVQKTDGSIGIYKNFYNDGQWSVNSLHKTFCLLTQSFKETVAVLQKNGLILISSIPKVNFLYRKTAMSISKSVLPL